MATVTEKATQPTDIVALREVLAGLEGRERKLYAILNTSTVDRVGSVTEDELLDAVANFPAVRVERAKAALTLRAAEVEQAERREAGRAKLRAEFHAKKQAAITTLKVKLQDARAASDAVKEVQLAEHEALAEPFDPLHFELDSRLEHWEQTITSYGFS